MALIIWTLGSLVFIFLGIYSFFSKKAMGFWANIEMFEVENIKKYNTAMCKMFCSFGFILFLLGLPLLLKENPLSVIITIFGTIFETIVFMIIYVTVIEPKYKKKN